MRHFRIGSLVLVGWLGVTCTLMADSPQSHVHDPVHIDKQRIEVGEGGQVKQVVSVSEYCLQCHGGSTQDSRAPRPVHSIGSTDRNHPVEVAYPAAEPDFVSSADLDPRLLLLDGRMTCVTCHDPEAADHALVIGTEQSRLCIACHSR